ncbi:GUN4 domain-containing protein [Roseofilum sp. BLCC_M154]|uniref:GUN4 domain-containing protein n=1 Tax=Roseofilum acuticapitatum BLCC-M154 TaxID=3022444 RepID=A0ABT7AWV8_9CYAN|nr:GUN4 domain-containing protein [Roseofilum acuticapitatum]MDJ1171406.1 GUN4 domain-containing protein [Roseofilum acuticapitatum BLCC-M154]
MEEVETRFEVRLIQLAEQVDRLTQEQEALKVQLAEMKGSGLSATIQARPVPPADAQPLQSESELDVPSDDIPLQSSSGQDYLRLDFLFRSGRWEEAHEETCLHFLKLTRNRSFQGLRQSEWQMVTSEDLQIIERLWLKYSHGKFGFSLQSQFYKQVGGNLESRDTVFTDLVDILCWYKDGDWIEYEDLIFDPEKAVRGHLPCLRGVTPSVYKVLLCREEWSQFPPIPEMEAQIQLITEREKVRSSNFYQEELTREREEERATLIDAFFKDKFTEIDEELLAVKEKMLALPKDKFADALLKLGQWSREQLLEHLQT